ncbi:hypothetical protein GCM10010245_18430 [Streptomyces spectabilis]|nr:hypothetical protein GCM10010245_18430 [Streptomyces spectabilis]
MHRAVELDDELTDGIGEKAPPDDFFGDAQRLGPAQLLEFEKSRHIGEAGVTNHFSALLNHVYVRPVPRARRFLPVEQPPYTPTH